MDLCIKYLNEVFDLWDLLLDFFIASNEYNFNFKPYMVWCMLDQFHSIDTFYMIGLHELVVLHKEINTRKHFFLKQEKDLVDNKSLNWFFFVIEKD